MKTIFWLAAVLGALALAGCDSLDLLNDLLPGEPKAKLPGERISVLNLERQLEPDPAILDLEVRLPRPVVNRDWPEAGGYPTHAMQHLALGDNVDRLWRRGVGEGDSRYGEILATPIIEGGRVFTLDATSVIYAVDAERGVELWRFDTKPKEAKSHTFGGGLAAVGDRLYAATGYGEVIALNAVTGDEIWSRSVPAPIHSAPTVADGRIFAVTVDNQLEALAADDGHVLWTHNGLPETAGLLGGASPAVDGDVVVVAYSSGELFALRTENGRPLWSDNLATARSLDALSALADIRGRPIIDRGMVFAISHSGQMVAIDQRTGDRIWEQDIGGSYSPWIAGEFIYLLTNDNSLACLTRREGRVRWVLDLPRYENEEKKKGTLVWTGPVLAGDRLIVLASDGDAISVSPYTGKALGRIEFPDGSFISPVLANKTLYVLTQEADLFALR